MKGVGGTYEFRNYRGLH